MVEVVEGFLNLPNLHAQAQQHAMELYSILTRRHSTYAGQPQAVINGTHMGSNALLVNPKTEEGYLQYHKGSGLYLPLGGSFDEADKEDPAACAYREACEEFTLFMATFGNNLRQSMRLLDIHKQKSTVAHKLGMWFFFTYGIWVPGDFTATQTVAGKPGLWKGLRKMQDQYDQDPANARAAGRALAYLQAAA
ncbi:MAG: hypothetical protein COY40_01145 [Alphaproteobacteria bacterium CG_4_10_14_0_8_um_filter_53_9]|nr:MAG: hypothetical protein COY40_01145 [Alphaproteobacteria bacterium CG_4_10_14_0_8_um_filter_53_9]